MISHRELSLIPALLLSAALGIFAETDEEWTIISEKNGVVETMSLLNPKTQLRIEAEVRLQLDNQGIPLQGRLKYRNDVSRDLTPNEVKLYWQDFNGERAFWKYLESQGKLVTINPTAIPEKAFGKRTKVVDKAGEYLIGKLQSVAGDPNSFALVIDGACCGPIYYQKNAVASLQQIK
jgi:hypothetical protein